jgi:mannose-6-phosphate isomerase-like protein (cupin superfamily)
MRKIEKISENVSYCAVNLGGTDVINEYALIHPVSQKVIEGKVFLKNVTGATGTEISFNSLAAHSEQPYFHIHRKNEETYIIIKGSGYFQIDDDCFGIQEGSVIRVAPEGLRGICNTSDQEMIYIVIQSKKDSLEEYTTADGERIAHQPMWR